jgi:hypothetical protein
MRSTGMGNLGYTMMLIGLFVSLALILRGVSHWQDNTSSRRSRDRYDPAELSAVAGPGFRGAGQLASANTE